MLAHIPDNIRDVGLLSEYSTEAMEGGHSWTNRVLVNASNSIPGERMQQVMTAKTTEEHTLTALPDVAAASQNAFLYLYIHYKYMHVCYVYMYDI